MQRGVAFIVLILLLTGCKEDPYQDTFNRKELLVNLTVNQILPSINTTSQNLIDLHSAALAFTSGPDSLGLSNLKTQFELTYLNFQNCKPFDFGPLNDYGVKAAMNTYPCDTAKVEGNISSGSYLLGTFENLTAIGLPALDYLLYYPSHTETVIQFTSGVNANQRKTYLTDLTAKMKNEFQLVVTAWEDYQHEFVQADGNDAGSSTSILFNQWIKDLELLKNAKIGIPAGFQTAGQTLPNYVEAYYSGISIALALENIETLKEIFTGGSGVGFDDYIIDVESDDVTASLSTQISDQFDLCIQKINAISGPLSVAVDSNFPQVEASYYEIKKLLTYCKTDMSSILGLLITYQDNDGD